MQSSGSKWQDIVEANPSLGKLKREEGIYYAAGHEKISYPEDGNRDSFTIEEDSFWFRHRNDCIIKAVEKFCGRDTVFFDVGGGNGFISRALQDAGIETVLVEPGADGVINARKRGVRNIICSTIRNTGFRRGDMPAIGLFDVIEHEEDDLKMLRTAREYLKNDGYVFITVPAHGFLWSGEDERAGHFRRYSTGLLKKKLSEAGFTGVYSTYLFGFLMLPILFLRALPYRLGLNRTAKEAGEVRKDYVVSGRLKKITDFLLKAELRRISGGKSLNFGSSCMVVAKKKTDG